MALKVMVDVERLTAAYLRSVPDVAALVGSRVYTAIPPEPTFPLVRLVRLGGTASYPHHLDRARLQVDAWDTGKAEAWAVTATVWAALHQMPGSHALGVVTAVEDAVAPVWSPDPETDRPRYVLDVYVYLHPHPSNP